MGVVFCGNEMDWAWGLCENTLWISRDTFTARSRRHHACSICTHLADLPLQHTLTANPTSCLNSAHVFIRWHSVSFVTNVRHCVVKDSIPFRSFRNTTLRRGKNVCRRFETTYRPHIQGSMTKNNTELLKMSAKSTFRNVGNKWTERSVAHPKTQEYSPINSKQDSGFLGWYVLSIVK